MFEYNSHNDFKNERLYCNVAVAKSSSVTIKWLKLTNLAKTN